VTHTGCHTPPIQSNICSITEPPLNPGPRNPTAALLAVRMLQVLMLLVQMMLLVLLLDLMMLLVLLLLGPIPQASRVVLPLDPMSLWDVMLRVSTVMMQWLVALGCVRVRSRCCSNN